MTLDALIILAGVLVAVMQFLGLPADWKDICYLVLGVVTVLLGIFVRRRIGKKTPKARAGGTFAENAPEQDRHETQ